MGKYNKLLKYNKKLNNEGFGYNYAIFKVLISVFDAVTFTDATIYLLISILHNERIKLEEFDEAIGGGHVEDGVLFGEDIDNYTMIEILESLSVSDLFLELLITISIHENSMNLIEESQSLAMILQDESFVVDDFGDLNALADVAENLGFEELSSMLALIHEYEQVKITDEDDALIAISDFYIGKDDTLDNRFSNWLIPFDLLIDERQSSMEIMPPSESTFIDLPYTDGSIVQDTVYKNKSYNIVGYSLQGMTIHQKEELKQKIVELLDGTKNEYKKMTFAKNGLSFDVKYSGELETMDAASWIKASIPFDVKPYGYRQFVDSFTGNGIIVNNGHCDLGFKVTIDSGCVNPNFEIGETEYLWQGTVPNGLKLIIDTEDKTCYLVNSFDVKTQAMQNLKSGRSFKSIPRGTSEVVTALNASTKDRILVEYQPKYLWKKSELEE